MKDYRSVFDVSCRAFKVNKKKQQVWKEIAMKLNKDGEPYLYRKFSQSAFILLSTSTQTSPCWFSEN